LETFNDSRIKYIGNSTFLGLSESRNQTVKHAKGEYLFFIDADCIAHKDWMETGIKSLQENAYLGVEGRIYYVSESYEPTYSDRIVSNINGKEYMTANIAYKKSAIEYVGGFDKEYTYHEDRDIAIRIMRQGEIWFNPEMLVYHQKSTWSPIRFIKSGNYIRNRVILYKKLNEKLNITWRVLFPENLIELVFPPILLAFLFIYRFRSANDWLIFLSTYPKLFYERLCFWDESLKRGIFLI
jgi:GT2 family glycosyltransferase